MADNWMYPFNSMHTIPLPCSETEIEVYRVVQKFSNAEMDEALMAEWVIISS